jgi:hypothetical protein
MKKGSGFSTTVNNGVVGIVENPAHWKNIDIRQFGVFPTFPQGIFIIIYVNNANDKIKSIAIMDGSARGVSGNWHSYRDVRMCECYGKME